MSCASLLTVKRAFFGHGFPSSTSSIAHDDFSGIKRLMPCTQASVPDMEAPTRPDTNESQTATSSGSKMTLTIQAFERDVNGDEKDVNGGRDNSRHQ